jgi:hypothetical protein
MENSKKNVRGHGWMKEKGGILVGLKIFHLGPFFFYETGWKT